MDLLSIGEKFGAMMFSIFSNADSGEMTLMQEVTKQHIASQQLVSHTGRSRRKKLKRLAKNKEHKVGCDSGNFPGSLVTSLFSTKDNSLAKGIQKRFGNRLNKFGFNYSAQLCFMKDSVFKRKVGVSRLTFEDLLKRVNELLESTTNKTSLDVSLRIRLLMTVIYLTSRKVYKDIHNLFGYSEAAVCRLIYKTILDINMLSSNAIKWPSDLESTSANFFKTANFPGVIGSIDAVHLVARAPEKLHDEYRNSKGKYTLILLAVCDAFKKFTFVSVGYPGTYSHSKCLESTDLGIHVGNVPNGYFPLKKYHIIGNDNFQLEEGLLVPYKGQEIQCEDHVEFNKRLLATQEIMSSTFSEMKSRFQTLNKLDMNIERVVEFTTACCVVHNVCVDNNDNWQCDDYSEEDTPNNQTETSSQTLSNSALAKRDLIKDQLYMGLNYG